MSRGPFSDAMRAGADAAWDSDWESAIAAYRRAVRLSPQDVDALSALGLAYYNAGQFAAALETYRQASALAPENPVLLERIADTHGRLGQRDAAIEAHMAAAELHARNPQTLARAVEQWQAALKVDPNHVQARVQLLQYHQRIGKAYQAATECLHLARIYQGRGETRRATEIYRYALRLAPDHPELQRSAQSIDPEARTASAPAEGAVAKSGGSALQPRTSDFVQAAIIEAEDERNSLIESTRRHALAALAASVFEDTLELAPVAGDPQVVRPKIDALIGQAVDVQTRGNPEQALASFAAVYEAGLRSPALCFNLGVLYQEQGRLDEAIAMLEQALGASEYELGGHLALGCCHQAKGDIARAVQHLLAALKRIDLTTVEGERVEQISLLYDNLVRSYSVGGQPDHAPEFAASMVQFISKSGWQERAIRARRRLDEVAQDGPPMTLADLLAPPGTEETLALLELIQSHIARDLLYTALEECYIAIGRMPTYLPIHRQLAQVLLRMGKREEVSAKLAAVGDTYRVRGQLYQAAEMYRSALTLMPVDTAVRSKLIDVLADGGHVDDALEHCMLLAENHYGLAQLDLACATYERALKLAAKTDSDQRWQVRILHEIGDLDLQRVDWRHAVDVYQRIRDLAPEDERARLALVDLHYRLGRPDQAMVELDGLLASYRQNKGAERPFAALEELVQRHEDDMPLRMRVAQAYLDAGQTQQALAHLDKLGDLLLDSGRYDDARVTVRAIVALNPPNVAEYRRLLEQLGQ